jgi:hypothetical protein
MENIIYTYDKDQSRKTGQFTIVLTPAVFNRGRWDITKGTKPYFVKDLETVAARVRDKALFRTALESEMGFRKNEARFFSHDQEFTRLRIASRHLCMFIDACRKQRSLIHPGGTAAAFRLQKDVIPEIGVRNDHLELHLGPLTMSAADIIVQTMPVTLIKGNHIVQVRLLRTETPLICTVKWEYVILDEAQAIKNADTVTARAVKHVPAVSRLSITGTPVENAAADLWSQFDFLMPGFLDDLAAFKDTYTDAAEDLGRLRQKTKPYILRRLKSQVLAELPPKTEVTIYCEFTEDQKAIYDQALVTARDAMETLTGPRSFHILRLILRLRQIACNPHLAIKESRKPLGSGKTEEILNAAMEILSAGHKILIFSQFTRHLKLIEGFFRSRDIPTYYLDGQTTDRGAVVQAFKSHAGACPFFISLKAGGTGLNLSEATYVFLLDPWWNPAVENQAIDRCHRIGQHQPVTIYRFITRDSIEEKVDELKTIKKQIESAVIDETAPHYLPFDEKTLKSLILNQHL